PIDPVSEERYAYLRRRWFKARGPDGEVVDLVGLDISSSQTQILASLLGLIRLEQLCSRSVRKTGIGNRLFRRDIKEPAQPVKEYLDGKGWELFEKGALTFEKDYAGKSYRKNDDGTFDEKLIELVKVTWMRTLYGSSPININRDIRKDIGTYGAAWSA